MLHYLARAMLTVEKKRNLVFCSVAYDRHGKEFSFTPFHNLFQVQEALDLLNILDPASIVELLVENQSTLKAMQITLTAFVARAFRRLHFVCDRKGDGGDVAPSIMVSLLKMIPPKELSPKCELLKMLEQYIPCTLVLLYFIIRVGTHL